MTITAKYAATCPCCNGPITPGTQIEWSKGAKARHVSCTPASGTPAGTYLGRVVVADMPRQRTYGRGRWTGCSCGSREDSDGVLIPSPRNCRRCEHDA